MGGDHMVNGIPPSGSNLPLLYGICLHFKLTSMKSEKNQKVLNPYCIKIKQNSIIITNWMNSLCSMFFNNILKKVYKFQFFARWSHIRHRNTCRTDFNKGIDFIFCFSRKTCLIFILLLQWIVDKPMTMAICSIRRNSSVCVPSSVTYSTKKELIEYKK